MSFAHPDEPGGLAVNPQTRKRRTVPWKLRFAVLAPSLCLYAVACATPAIYFTEIGVGPSNWYGIGALLMGWMGFFVEQFGWFANPILFLSYILVLFRQFMIASIVAVLAIAVALKSTGIIGQQVPADEGNVNHLLVVGFGIAYKFWLASIAAAVIVPLIGSVVVRMRWRRENQQSAFERVV